MKIGIDTYPLQERATASRGIGRYVRGLTRALQRLPNVEILMYAVVGQPLWELPRDNATSHLMAIHPALDPMMGRSWALDEYLSSNGGNPDNLDVLLSTSALRSLVHPHPNGPRRACTHFDVISEVFSDQHLATPERQQYYADTMSLLATYDHILTLSHHAKADLCSRHPIDPAKVHVIGCGIDPIFHAQVDRDEEDEDRGILADLDVPPPGQFLLNVGGLDPRKGSRRLIEAMALLPPDLRLPVVFAFDADPIARGALTRHAESLGLPKDLVKSTGWIPDRSLAALYRGCSVMVFPSLYEGFGLPIVEALACGCRVLCGDNSSQSIMAQGGAILVDAADPADIAQGIRHALSGHSMLPTLRREGRDWCRRYTWEATARAAYDVFAGVPVPV